MSKPVPQETIDKILKYLNFKWADRAVANACGVSEGYVKKVRQGEHIEERRAGSNIRFKCGDRKRLLSLHKGNKLGIATLDNQLTE